ncbi:hypothetical protein N7462_003048 [Penicillium macrosclerotiorum]|uniref:uncharacterized protein n=1 Tax=Penicillium macrosclerotiorum TaxID=303699 RepID=UPI0025491F63|nr:uncharacterized protein N7462_003048 [Penicillium macrosclerotiorum]KAJ5688656.1 hypothetical protein N7462_003048 [Penicillium macrosclerotiorum]
MHELSIGQLSGIIASSSQILEGASLKLLPSTTQAEEVDDAKKTLLDACRCMIRTASGPTEVLKEMALIDRHNLSTLRVINHYRIFDLVPEEDSVSIKEVAANCGLPKDLLCRILRQAMSYGAFTEPELDHVAHTTLSKAMARMSPLLSYQLEVCLPSSLRLLDWLGAKDRGMRSPFQIAHDTTKNWWDFAEANPDLLHNYGQYMALITSGGPHDVSHVVSGYHWGDLGQDAIVVDVGGADGFVGIRLAEEFSNLTVLIQDNEHLKERADASIPEALLSRVVFMPHSFFEPQGSLARQADVFLLRHILHDWDDNSCIVILRLLAASLKPGASIVIAEQILPLPGSLDKTTERVMRALDLQMMTQFGSCERTAVDWEKLFIAADPTLKVVRVVQPSGSADTLMEVKKIGADKN